MQRHRVSVSAVIEAPAARVYGIIADYKQWHPRIVPKQYFGPITVLKGGVGAGTEIAFQMHALGRTVDVHQVVSEPEPGRVLVEETATGAVTSFTVTAEQDGHCCVTIATELPARAGPLGALVHYQDVHAHLQSGITAVE